MPNEQEVTCPTCDKPADSCSCVGCTSCNWKGAGEELCSRCDQCESCCDCWVCARPRCNSGGDGGIGPCSNCERCEHCCECYICQSCNEYVSELDCSECEHCAGCGCTCVSEEDEERNHSGVNLINRRLSYHIATKTEHKRNPSRRLLAVELEICQSELDKASYVEESCRRWKCSIQEDGSLPNRGYEISTAPASGDKFISLAEDVCKGLDIAGALVGKECGLHVHIDARDFSYWEIRKLIILYAALEDTLFSLLPPSRTNNRYCQKCGDGYLEALERGTLKDTRKAIAGCVYGPLDKSVKGRKKDKYGGNRYAALNLHSWFYRGSVECRMGAGTIKSEKVIQWALLWAGIMDYVYGTTERKLKALLNEKQGMDLLLAIAPEGVQTWIVKRRDKFAHKTSQ